MLTAVLLLLTPPPVVTVTSDDILIDADCIVEIVAESIPDANDDGVIRIVKDGITVDFDGAHLHGAADGVDPDAFAGVGLVIAARNVTVKGLSVSGYRVGIRATDADGLVIEHCDVSGNFQQRLKSTPKAEDGSDWLWPHDNDAGQWQEKYGAGLLVESSDGVTVRRIRAHDGQNGIILDRVNESEIYDNDCSFLSGWGLALWRSSRNVICRNALDFCVRGYSHAVYNRGQDSAGLLMFEQCCDNVIALNSITHGGDGVFAFSGREALGEANPREDGDWYRSRGNNRNFFAENDLSYAVAHGLELTFAFDNRIVRNRLHGNGICGIWGGYSQRTQIIDNEFVANGDMAYGLERGGINIEHGLDNEILINRFVSNACGIHLWWDEDAHLTSTPWARANPARSSARIAGNRFRDEKVPLHLRECGAVLCAGNRGLTRAKADIDETSAAAFEMRRDDWERPEYPVLGDLPGEASPVGARPDLRGRENIIMTEWGPWDHASPLLRALDATSGRPSCTWEVRGTRPLESAVVEAGQDVEARLTPSADGGTVEVVGTPAGGVSPFRVRLTAGDASWTVEGSLLRIDWNVTVFPWTVDPREDVEAWRAEAKGDRAATSAYDHLMLDYAMAGPASQDLADVGTDRFGTIATTTVALPEGIWRIKTRSDDGIRLWVNDELLIDDWTWHAPRVHESTFESTGDETRIRVEHFELDGYAVLEVELAPAGAG